MNGDTVLVGVTVALVTLSLVGDRRRTWGGLRKGARMLYKLLPQFLLLLVFVSIFVVIVPQATLAHAFSQRTGLMAAALAGSVALIPGPIAYPLAAMLAEEGVPYTVLAVFVTTLMMVGVMTLPIEKAYFGIRIAILRNLLSLIGALFVGITVGLLI